MDNFEHLHPRGHGGRFVASAVAETDVDLGGPAQPSGAEIAADVAGLSQARRDLAGQGGHSNVLAVRAIEREREALLVQVRHDSDPLPTDSDLSDKQISYLDSSMVLYSDGSWTDLAASNQTGGDLEPAQERYAADSDFVQNGGVADVVDHAKYGPFYRQRPGIEPDFPSAMRFQSQRPISDEEMHQSASLIGYAYASQVRGEPMHEPQRDSPYSFIVVADTTHSPRRNVTAALADFEENLPQMFRDGSPVRTSDRAGAGTKGTRLVDGFGDDAPQMQVYYDSVTQSADTNEDERSR